MITHYKFIFNFFQITYHIYNLVIISRIICITKNIIIKHTNITQTHL